jgi:2-haloacid dehalogenase
MNITLAFDVYGTLIDTQGVVTSLEQIVGEPAEAFARSWRDKQLEYAFRRGLMQNYETFAKCTEQALRFCSEFYGIQLTDSQIQHLMQSYQTLPSYPDSEEGLVKLQARGLRLFAFSNGTEQAVDRLLSNASIRNYFIDLVSVDDIKSFKPNPAVYEHFLSKAESHPKQTWLVSSNPFDVLGAVSAGLGGIWVQRNPSAVFDPWGIEPTLTVKNLVELDSKISSLYP